MSRALGDMEHGVWRLDQVAPLNFTTTGLVRGPLEVEAARAALPALAARHPLLRSAIAPGSPARFLDGAPPLALREVRSADWVAVLEEEINTRVPDAGPLARFTLVHGEAGATRLMVTLHHAIGDGLSGAYLLRDWLAALSRTPGNAAAAPALAPRPALDALLPRGFSGARAFLRHVRYLASELLAVLRHGQPLRPRRDATPLAMDRRARVIPVELPPETTAALVARARDEDTTVHGALSAAMLLGVLADAGRPRAGVAFGSPVNLRGALTPAVGDDVGFFVSMATFRATARLDEPLWALARRVRQALEQLQRRGTHLSLVDLMPRILRWLGAERLSPRALAQRWEGRIVATTGLTNLGRLQLEDTFGPLTLETSHFAVSPSLFGEFLATATTLRGRLCWNFVWTDPTFTEAHARALVADVVARLEAALRAPVGQAAAPRRREAEEAAAADRGPARG